MFANFCLNFAETLLAFAEMLLDFAKVWPIFAGIPPELRVVSKLVNIKCDLIFGCKNMFDFCDEFVFECCLFDCSFIYNKFKFFSFTIHRL